MLAAALARSLDPALLALDAGVTLDGWQSDLLRARPRRAVLNCSRQSGKSTTVAFAVLDAALNEAESLIVLCSPSQRQSGELLRTVKGYYERLAERDRESVPELAVENVLRLEFRNGSRVVAMPGENDGKTIRGLSAARLIVFDEASRCSDELFSACRPMLATRSDGQLILLSTPAGKRGFFYNIWINGDSTWYRVRLPASQCPRISKEFLDDELKELGPTLYQQEYELAFIDDMECAFSTNIIDNAFSSEVLPLWN